MTLHTRGIFSLAVRSWERLLARLIIGEPDTALTSDPAYLAILSPKPFGPVRGLQLLICRGALYPTYEEAGALCMIKPVHPLSQAFTTLSPQLRHLEEFSTSSGT